jgi:hypothetical protein
MTQPVPSQPAPTGRKKRQVDPRALPRQTRRSFDERGDIAGWVMITVMTIMLAGAITAIFTPAVTGYLESAIAQFM